MKVAAHTAALPVLQPERPRDPTFRAEVKALDLDLAVVVAYGHLLPPPLLDIPRLGFVNIHASLLPRWRGAAPIHWAIKTGDPDTGVSIMRLEAGLDTGPTWAQRRLPIGPADTTGLLFERLALLGRDTLLATLPLIASGIEPTPQPDDGVTLAPKVTRETARITWDATASHVSAHIRAMDPFPGGWTTHEGTDLKLSDVSIAEGGPEGPPGTVSMAMDSLIVSCQRGAVHIGTVQPAGRRRMTGGEWYRGQSGSAAVLWR